VYRAQDDSRDQLVAVKAFRLDAPPEQAERIASALEVLVTTFPRHRGLVELMAAGLERTTPYLVMAHCAAPSLDTRLRPGAPLEVDEALAVISTMAAAIDAAHARAIVHGSLHPRDVFVDDLGDGRIAGFGIARVLADENCRAPIRRPYSAPERSSSSAIEAPADLFALGAMAFELLTGRRVVGFGADAASRLSLNAPNVDPDRLRTAFAAMLAEQPAHRPSSASAFAQSLMRAVQPRSTPRLTRRDDDDATIAAVAAAGLANAPLEPSLRDLTDGVDTTEGASADALELFARQGTLWEPRAPLDRPAVDKSAAEIDPLSLFQPEHGPTSQAPDPKEPPLAPLVPGPAPAVIPERQDAASQDAASHDRASALVEDASANAAAAAAERRLQIDEDELAAQPPVLMAGPMTIGDEVPVTPAEVSARPDDVEARDVRDAREARDGRETRDAREAYGDRDTYDEREASEDEDAADADRDPDAEMAEQEREEREPALARSSAAVAGSLFGLSHVPVASDATTRTSSAPFDVEPDAAMDSAASARMASTFDPYRGDEQGGGAGASFRLLLLALAVGLAVGGAGGFLLGQRGAQREAAEQPASAASLPADASATPATTPPDDSAAVAGREVRRPGATDTASADRGTAGGASSASRGATPPAAAAASTNRPDAARSADAQRTGRLVVRSSPPQSEVAIDGARHGVTPLTLTRLPLGTHTVRVTRRGYAPEVRRVTLSAERASQTLSVELERVPAGAGDASRGAGTPAASAGGTASTAIASRTAGALQIVSRPAGAQVSVDGRLVGATPLVLSDVTPGSHTIRLELIGHQPWSSTVAVTVGQRARVAASLEPVP